MQVLNKSHFLKILTRNNAQCNIDCTLLLRLIMNNYHIKKLVTEQVCS